MKEITHNVSIASGPLRAAAVCSCGWRHLEYKRQNALGRASKLRGAANRHLKETGAKK